MVVVSLRSTGYGRSRRSYFQKEPQDVSLFDAADGTIPAEAQRLLLGIGEWLQVNGEAIYVIALGWPQGELPLRSITIAEAGSGARVQLLGHDGDVGFRVDDEKQLVLRVPNLSAERRPCRHAYAFRLTGFKASLRSGAR